MPVKGKGMEKEPFQKMNELINNVFNPAVELLSASDDHDMKLQALSLKSMTGHMEEVCKAAADPGKTIALVEFGFTPQLFYAFDCVPLILEGFSQQFAALRKPVIHEFLDAAELAGLPSEVCSTDRFIVGAAISGEFPKNSILVTCSQPCDGTRLAYPVLQKALGVPAIYIEAPTRYGREAARWYGKQIRKELIPFLEEATGRKFDIDRFREIIEESNRAYELVLEIIDSYTLTPLPVPASVMQVPYFLFSWNAGHPGATREIEAFHKEVVRRLKEGVPHPVEEKYRVIWFHIPPHFTQISSWMQKKLGACVVSTMLSGSAILDPIDTTDVESMFEGYAWQGLDMTMSLMRYDTRKMIEYTLQLYHQYRCNAIIVSQHVGCNNICGLAGIMRRHFQKEGIPTLFLELDYNDDRIVSTELLRSQIEDFFGTITV
jgi:benzoyl-CoA reductase subunit B